MHKNISPVLPENKSLKTGIAKELNKRLFDLTFVNPKGLNLFIKDLEKVMPFYKWVIVTNSRLSA